MRRFFLAASLLVFSTLWSAFPQTLRRPYLEVYTEDWRCFSYGGLCAICSPCCRFAYGSNTILTLAFSSFNVASNGTLSGFTETQAEIEALIAFVHLQGGFVKVSFGGATQSYQLSRSSYWPNNMEGLASAIAASITKYGFDGVDLDLEDAAPSNFASTAIELLGSLRGKTTKMVSVTLPAQGWAATNYAHVIAIGGAPYVDAINFMEYDIWVNSPMNNYPQQIVSDIHFYIDQWKLSHGQVVIGLMPGNDDLTPANNLALFNALTLTLFAQQMNLPGVMVWDLNRDYAGLDGELPLAYNSAIRQQLLINVSSMGTPAKRSSSSRPSSFLQGTYVQQEFPPHGPP